MGKIILEFDSVEESRDARVAMDAMRWKMVVWDLDQKLRSIVKYGTSISNNGKEATSEERDIAELLRDELKTIVSDYYLSLED